MRLIDADAFDKFLENAEAEAHRIQRYVFASALNTIRGNLREFPTAETVVRCKDCDWWTKQVDSAQGRCALSGTYPTGGWYCANGRRKGADNEKEKAD